MELTLEIDPDIDLLHLTVNYTARMNLGMYLRVHVHHAEVLDHWVPLSVILKPDNVRDWDREWSHHFCDPAAMSENHDENDLGRWTKLMEASRPTISPQSIFLLPIFSILGQGSEFPSDSGQCGFLVGLILIPTGEAAGEFRRIGMFKTAPNQYDMPWNDEILEENFRLSEGDNSEGGNNVNVTVI